MGQSDGGYLGPIQQALLPSPGLKLCSQFPQNLWVWAQVTAVLVDDAGGGDGIPQADDGS